MTLKNHIPSCTITIQVRQPEPFIGSKEYASIQVAMLEEAETGSFLEWLRLSMEAFELISSKMREDCEDFLRDKALMLKLIENGYDFVVYDPIEMVCPAVLANELDVPMATINFPITPWIYRVPMFYSNTPSPLSITTDKMTFVERLKNLLLELYLLRHWYQDAATLNQTIYDKPIKGAAEILQSNVIWFYLYNSVTHYPRPLMPNTIEVGDLIMREGQPLTKEYRDIVNDPERERIVIMSLGSYFKHLPEHWHTKFCEAFQQVC